MLGIRRKGERPAAKYDAVVVGSPVRLGRHPREIVDYITTNRGALATKPNAYFSVSSTSDRPYDETPTFEDRFFRRVDWKPHHAAMFASTLRGRFYTWALQRLLARMDKATDWDAVGRFADRLDQVVTRAAPLTEPRTDVRTETRPDSRTDARPDSRTETRTETRTDSRTDVRLEPRTDIRPERGQNPAATPGPKPGPTPHLTTR